MGGSDGVAARLFGQHRGGATRQVARWPGVLADSQACRQDAKALFWPQQTWRAGADPLYGEGVLAYDRVVERQRVSMTRRRGHAGVVCGCQAVFCRSISAQIAARSVAATADDRCGACWPRDGLYLHGCPAGQVAAMCAVDLSHQGGQALISKHREHSG